jgi:hypothetical protein
MDAEPETTAKPASKPMSPKALFVFGLILLLAGAVVTWLGATEVRRTLQLQDANTHVEAKVVDTAIHSNGNSGSRDVVRYRFQVEGDSYSYTDATGQRNLWASVGRDEWEDARDSGKIDVVYADGDPWINRPASSDIAPNLDNAAGLLFGLAMLGTGIVMLVRSRRRAEMVGVDAPDVSDHP